MLGGLARRAGALDARRSGVSTSILTLFGAYELQAPDKPTGPPELARALGKAYAVMKPDILFMTPSEERWLDSSSAPFLANWIAADKDPRQMILNAGGRKVGVVLFPMLPDSETEPSSGTIDSVIAAARELKGQASLIVGMSSWGETGEAKLLVQGDPIFHILLGSGPGRGSIGRLECEQKTLWIRAYSRGIVLQVIDVLEWPENRHDWNWEHGENFKLTLERLNDEFPMDMDIYRLFSEFTENPGN